MQTQRFVGIGIHSNTQMKNKQVKQFCELDDQCKKIMGMAVEKFDLSTRAYFRILKVARTVADLDGKEKITANHLAEAISYREKVF